MEDVLNVYERPYDPKRPVVCIDEKSKELRDTPNGEIPAQPKKTSEDGVETPGQATKEDYEYSRHGSCNLFVAVEPLAGRRYVSATETRKKTDFAVFVKYVVDVMYPDADVIVMVLDNLNTHTPAALYETFPAAEAGRIAAKIEWHYTPEHGSWLNIAECELSVLAKQCLNRRLESLERVKSEVKAWMDTRNSKESRINWQFRTSDARIRLKRLYPVIEY
jgi:DDE superfamily endonuclease